VRGTLLGVTSAVLAVAAHEMAGGGIPNVSATLVITTLVAWAGTGLASKTRSVSAMLALLGVSQVSLHILLTYVSSHQEIVLAPAMLTTHVVATACTAVLLTWASDALDMIAAAVVGLVRLLITVLVRTTRQQTHTTAVTPVFAVGHLLDVVFRRVCTRRGPPLFS
jgi:predicted ferric reductase